MGDLFGPDGKTVPGTAGPLVKDNDRHGMPSLSIAQIAQISALVAGYIREQSERFAGRAAGIASNLRVPVNGFFQPALLAATSIVVLQNEHVDNPDFYPMLRVGFGTYRIFRQWPRSHSTTSSFRMVH